MFDSICVLHSYIWILYFGIFFIWGVKTKNWILNSRFTVTGPENTMFFLSLFPHSHGVMMMAKHDTSQENLDLVPAVPHTHTHTWGGMILVDIGSVIVWVYHIFTLMVIEASMVVICWLLLLVCLVLWKSSKCKKHHSPLTFPGPWFTLLWGLTDGYQLKAGKHTHLSRTQLRTSYTFLQWSKAAPSMPCFSGWFMEAQQLVGWQTL